MREAVLAVCADRGIRVRLSPPSLCDAFAGRWSGAVLCGTNRLAVRAPRPLAPRAPSRPARSVCVCVCARARVCGTRVWGAVVGRTRRGRVRGGEERKRRKRQPKQPFARTLRCHH